jgi:bifunctional non-homologous end joining protein LigD
MTVGSATTVHELDAGYELDLAWDGHRAVACGVDGVVRLFAGDLREWTLPFAPVTRALAQLVARDFVLDGFLCVLDDDGRPSFEHLRAWVRGTRTGTLVYAAWDVLRLDEVDLRRLSLPERRAKLRALLSSAEGTLVRSDTLEGPLDAVLASVAAAKLPGVVARPVSALPSAKRWILVSATGAPLEISRPLSPAPAVTNKDKVLYPRDGLTKQHVVDYYADVAQALLPVMRDRPIVCQRWPDGIDDFTWFQHRVPPRAPDFLEAVMIDGNRRILINNREALAWMANQAALTFHGWASRVATLEQPDWAVLDLDPGPSTRWEQVIDVALAVRALLELLQVDSVVKTSGQKGLHVLVPLGPGHTTEEAHRFAALVASAIHHVMPDVVALEADKVKRRGRLFLDHLQNFAGKTLVLAYSLRAVDQACVSAPLEWCEVTPALDPTAFTARTMRARLDAKGDLFARALSGSTKLGPLIRRLGG